jgi:long-subunit acyl-CoA synthetase (AMP-forming)
VTVARIGVMDDEGNLLLPGERGEIVVRSSMTMKCYYKKPADTAEAAVRATSQDC